MLKNKLWVIVLLGYCVIAFYGCAKREIKNIDSKGTNIVCFGDSITFGYGAERGEDYPAELSKMTQIPVINAGIDGDTSTKALIRINPDVLDKEPLLVIIEFSGNDFLERIPRDTTLKNIREMIDQIQAKNAMVAIVDVSAGILLKEYHPVLYNLAREKGAIFIPHILSGIITNPNLKSDFIHPNADGYKIIARIIYSAIIPYLNKNTLARELAK